MTFISEIRRRRLRQPIRRLFNALNDLDRRGGTRRTGRTNRRSQVCSTGLSGPHGRVYIGTDPATGRRLDRSVTVRGTKADAERELAEMVAAAQAARAVGVRSTVSELLEAWFAVAATGWAPTTIRQTRSVLDRYLHPHLGRVAVGDVTAAMIDSTYAMLRRRGGIHGRPLSAGTLARVHVVLRAACSQAMRWGWVWDNPVDRAHRLLTISRELQPPTPDELRRLLDHVAARDPQFHALLVFAATTGARRAQLHQGVPATPPRRPACARSGCTTCATSWPPKCSMPSYGS
jgi:integrase